MAAKKQFNILDNMAGLAPFPDSLSEGNVSVATPEKTEPVKSEKVSRESSEPMINLKPAAKKETKTRHKTFLLTDSYADAFAKLAKERNQSENALFNDILSMILNIPE